AMPIMVAGRNDKLAWGLTNTGPDTQDLFIERVDPADSARYLTPDGSAPFVTREETISVRGRAPVALTVRETRHGPVVSNLIPDTEAIAGAGAVLALAWTGLDEDDVTLAAGFELARAGDPAELDRALREFGSPQQ